MAGRQKMADDMANGNGGAGDDRWGRLSERVENQGKDITDLRSSVNDVRSNMNTGFQNLQSALGTLANDNRRAVEGLTASMAERSRPQWQALGVALTFAALLGGLAYMPIREATSDLKSSVQALTEKMVTRQEMDWRSERGAEDRARTDETLRYLRDNSVSLVAWQERNRAIDASLVEANRRLDELRQDFGAVYGTRDVIVDMKREIESLRSRINTP